MDYNGREVDDLRLPTIEEEQEKYDSFKRGRFTIVVEKAKPSENYSIKGKNIVFTGRGPYTRGTLMKMARNHGAFATSNTISKTTEILVVGEKPGSKLTKAKREKIKIISMEEFLSQVNNNQ